jgi:hypothetical protein
MTMTINLTLAVHSGFTMDTIEFISQQINDQLGQSFAYGMATPYYANNWELSAGTSSTGGGATFAGPMLKISKYESYPDSFGSNPGQCGGYVAAGCNAALAIGVESLSNDYMESQGLFIEMEGAAPNANCPTGMGTFACNISGLQEDIRSNCPVATCSATTMMPGEEPSGGLIQVRDESSGIRAGDKGLEIDTDNNSGVDDNGFNGNNAGVGNGGLILVSKGNEAVAFGTHRNLQQHSHFAHNDNRYSGCTGHGANLDHSADFQWG